MTLGGHDRIAFGYTGNYSRRASRIYEFLPTMLHQKIVIVDDAWAAVGTANFDNRSFSLNDETSVCFLRLRTRQSIARCFCGRSGALPKVDLAEWRTPRIVAARRRAIRSLIEDQV